MITLKIQLFGGRGAFSSDGKLIDKRWNTTFENNGIKLIEPIKGKNVGKVPTLSKRPNEIYAILNSKNKLKSIVFYGEDREIKYEAHFDHYDGKKKPHVMIMKDGKPYIRNADFVNTPQISNFLKFLEKRRIDYDKF